jgi:hypothetical protein
MTTTTETAKPRGPRPTFRAWLVTDATHPETGEAKPLWTEITGLWPTKTGSGFSGGITKPLPPTGGRLVILPACQSAPKRDPESAFNSDPHQRLSSGRPRSPRRGPARVAQCPHERRSDARGEALWAPGGDPRATGLSFGS